MKEIKLPSGKKAKIREGKGKDLLNAWRKAKNNDEIVFALIAELVEIDGKKVIYEDLLEMDLKDVLAIQAEVVGDFLSLQQGI
ncbi:hypothetical protein THER_2041 [Thermodesulfovibrio sp. N1]|uniref:hypothetical protein n=1 Tax=unclassified Thermodesulfovibrio TaxID=2645936 RepID=UPI00083A907D|nr:MULTISPECIES: hypothetical protein [unclassified Thermodesulfovibrio]MDI1471930.1 hypothetical protein [Thermodesulfovibrio sp. 1176]ODA43237.1 hypothetical protein THER_2041 [Thermodesulfovibrio sp. N1]